jgi:hypothetical protein
MGFPQHCTSAIVFEARLPPDLETAGVYRLNRIILTTGLLVWTLHSQRQILHFPFLPSGPRHESHAASGPKPLLSQESGWR